MIQRLWVPGPLPGLNEILDAKVVSSKRTKSGKTWNAYADLKKKWGTKATLYARAQGFQGIGRGYFTYLLREPDKRRDPSNVIAGAVKILEDALQDAGLLVNDGWANVLGIAPHWMVDSDSPGATVFVSLRRLLSFEEAVLLDGKGRQRGYQFNEDTQVEDAVARELASAREGNAGHAPLRGSAHEATAEGASTSDRLPAGAHRRAGGSAPS